LAAPSQAHWQRALQEFHLHTPLGLKLDSTISFTALKFLLFCFRERSKTKNKMKRANEKIIQINTQKWILTTIVEIGKEKTLSTKMSYLSHIEIGL
jgi:hypothetical protein